RRNPHAVLSVTEPLIDVGRAGPERQLRAHGIRRPEASAVLGRVRELVAFVALDGPVADDVAVEPRLARYNLHALADVADNAELEAVDDLLAEIQLRRAPAGLNGHAGVVLFRAEDRGSQQHAPIEQLPFAAELEGPSALGIEIGVAFGQVLGSVAERVA